VVGIGPDGVIEEVVIVDYQEIRGKPIAKRRFLRQYDSKSLKHPLQLRQDIQGITENPNLGPVERVYESAKASLLNPRGSLPSLGESAPQFFAGAGALKAAGIGGNALAQTVGINALLEGPGGSQGAAEEVAQTPLETLRKSPRFAALEQQFGTERAMKIAQETAGSSAYLPAAAGGGLASLVTGGGGEGRLLSGLLKEGAESIVQPGLSNAAKFVGKETLKSGAREMPVWGAIFAGTQRLIPGVEDPETRIRSILDYIRTFQTR